MAHISNRQSYALFSEQIAMLISADSARPKRSAPASHRWAHGANRIPIGTRAMDFLNLEQSCRLIPKEISIKYSAFESGLDGFVRLELEQDYSGKQGLPDRKQPDHMNLVPSSKLKYSDMYKATVIEEYSYDPPDEKLRA